MPAGYVRHMRRSPLTDPWEPLFARETDTATRLAVEIRDAHCNGRGFAHGGLISALADNAMGLSAVRLASLQEGAHRVGTRGSAVTVTLSVDFIDAARVGDWLEFLPVVAKVGRTLSFVGCSVVCGERPIARASATFRML